MRLLWFPGEMPGPVSANQLEFTASQEGKGREGEEERKSGGGEVDQWGLGEHRPLLREVEKLFPFHDHSGTYCNMDSFQDLLLKQAILFRIAQFAENIMTWLYFSSFISNWETLYITIS